VLPSEMLCSVGIWTFLNCLTVGEGQAVTWGMGIGKAFQDSRRILVGVSRRRWQSIRVAWNGAT
jgi:hypothetical protein